MIKVMMGRDLRERRDEREKSEEREQQERERKRCIGWGKHMMGQAHDEWEIWREWREANGGGGCMVWGKVAMAPFTGMGGKR